MAAPVFVLKEEAEDLVVPEASGLSVTETGSNERRGRRSYFRNGETSLRWLKTTAENIQM